MAFFIGILWFYWISFSFRFYDLGYLIPLVILGVGFIYGFIFFIINIFSKTLEIRALLLFSISFLSPFGFNWFKPELILINSYFSTDIYVYALFLTLIVVFIRLKKYWKSISVFLLISLSFYNPYKASKIPTLNVAIPNTNLSQDKKWNKKYRKEIIEGNFYFIEEAIKLKKDLIILHESAFPTYLNLDEQTLERLAKLSHKINIITGALHVKENRVFNSSYFFHDGTYQRADKVVLVPFGEKIPLPKFAVDFINKTFFNGADDYQNATKTTNFNIKGYTFRNAICYEATTDKLFENSPKFMIAISNNAWFTPSIEPTLQKLLLTYYSRKYHTTIYHSANVGINIIIN